MELGIVGLPGSGKTALFNSLTRGRAQVHAFGQTTLEPNIGVVKVPDARLHRLEALVNPKKVIPAEVKYVDVAIHRDGADRQDEVGSQVRGYLSSADALMYVVRAFADDSVPHIKGSVDPARDIGLINLEFTLSDLRIVERRLARIVDSLKGAKQQEREALHREEALLHRLKGALGKEQPIRLQTFALDEVRLLENYQFLTAKPVLAVLNMGEPQLPQASALEQTVALAHPGLKVAAVCAKLEMELSQLGQTDAAEFRAALGIAEGALDRIIRLSYEVLGLISFFTVASAELRAWTVPERTPAQKAAGKIHSDMERGFIRAEVVSYADLVASGSLAEARKKGLLRLEGKTYPVRDGDV
ncbi:MAG: redox-regulated ATPase YchF, partial [Chloroflexi bacterium]|nr:redox-regulated ATPase YchF [Chloroflexota bacterium]